MVGMNVRSKLPVEYDEICADQEMIDGYLSPLFIDIEERLNPEAELTFSEAGIPAIWAAFSSSI
jgi:hypothetical protein